MEEFEITCIETDDNGIITHVGLKKDGTQPVDIIVLLIHHKVYSFHTFKEGMRKEVYYRASTDGKRFLTIDPYGSLNDTLNFLPECS